LKDNRLRRFGLRPNRKRGPGRTVSKEKEEENKTKLLRYRYAIFSNHIRRPFCAAFSYKAETQTPPAVLAVGAGEKGANPHAPFSPALPQRNKPQKQRKNPGSPPLAVQSHNRRIKHRGELVVVSPPRPAQPSSTANYGTERRGGELFCQL